METDKTNYNKIPKKKPIESVEPATSENAVKEEPVVTYVKAKIIGCTNLNLRSGPSFDAEVLKVLKAGTEVKLDESDKQNGFTRAIVGSTVGYLKSEYVGRVE